jgi:hypothetical protein
MKRTIIWEVTPCSPVEVQQFGETYCFHTGHSSAFYLLHSGFLLRLFFDPEDGGDVFLQNVGQLLTD